MFDRFAVRLFWESQVLIINMFRYVSFQVYVWVINRRPKRSIAFLVKSMLSDGCFCGLFETVKGFHSLLWLDGVLGTHPTNG